MGIREPVLVPLQTERDQAWRSALTAADGSLGDTRAVLAHLLRGHDSLLLNDAVIARVRGIMGGLAEQLAQAVAAFASPNARDDGAQAHDGFVALLADALFEVRPLLTHVHALALEWQLAERTESRLALDPVLPPLLQARIGADDADAAAIAVDLLAAQARFAQAMRRMSLPLQELPGDLFHLALITMRTFAEGQAGARAEAHLRQDYNERQTRLGLIERVIIALRDDAAQALVLERAGAALFLTALAIGSGQDRDAVAFATAETQIARLALSLTACGLSGDGLAAQVLAVHPAAGLPEGLAALRPDRAAELLAASYGGNR